MTTSGDVEVLFQVKETTTISFRFFFPLMKILNYQTFKDGAFQGYTLCYIDKFSLR